MKSSISIARIWYDVPLERASDCADPPRTQDDALKQLTRFRIKLEELEIDSAGPSNRGGFGVVRLADYHSEAGTVKVAVKDLISDYTTLPLRTAYVSLTTVSDMDLPSCSYAVYQPAPGPRDDRLGKTRSSQYPQVHRLPP